MQYQGCGRQISAKQKDASPNDQAAQASSAGESLSMLAFGPRVQEMAVGRPSRSCRYCQFSGLSSRPAVHKCHFNEFHQQIVAEVRCLLSARRMQHPACKYRLTLLGASRIACCCSCICRAEQRAAGVAAEGEEQRNALADEEAASALLQSQVAQLQVCFPCAWCVPIALGCLPTCIKQNLLLAIRSLGRHHFTMQVTPS